MSHTWKLLPIAALFALAALVVLPGGPSHPDSAHADRVCGSDGRIIVTIIDVDTGDPLPVAGTEIEVSPDPFDGAGSPNYVDNVSPEDDDNDASIIELDNTCYDDGGGTQSEFTVTLIALPAVASTCDLVEDEVTTDFPAQNATVDVELEIDCDGVNLSPSPTVTTTTTAGPAATINVSSSNNNLGCGATSIVTITVRRTNGQAVAAGTLVNIVADKGSVSPASGQTTADGSVFVFYTAPNNAGGEATITAASGSALGTTEIDVNCNVAPTQAPPPTTVPNTGIQPPNTGDAGLIAGNSNLLVYVAVTLVVATVAGTLSLVRRRA